MTPDGLLNLQAALIDMQRGSYCPEKDGPYTVSFADEDEEHTENSVVVVRDRHEQPRLWCSLADYKAIRAGLKEHL